MTISIEEADRRIGDSVVYRPRHLKASEPGEEGIITSVNTAYVFVRYSTHGQGIATPPECLDFVTPK